MRIQKAFEALDSLILSKFGNLSEALQTADGESILRELLAVENRNELREWYRPAKSMNSLAAKIKEILENKLGERL